MKTILFILTLTFFAAHASASTCSNDFIKQIKQAYQSTVYTAEKILVVQEFDRVAIDAIKEVRAFEVVNYSAQEMNQCITAYKAYVAPSDPCMTILQYAESMYNKLTLSALADMAEAEREFFTNYKAPSYGGYSGLDKKLVSDFEAVKMVAVEEVVVEEELAVERVTFEDTYTQYFYDNIKFRENCAAEYPEIDVYVNPEIDYSSRKGIATVEVFDSAGKLKCFFVDNVVEGEVNIEVPSNLVDCVQNTDHSIVTEVEWIDEATGLISSEYAVGAPDEFVSNDIAEEPKVTASDDSTIKNVVSNIRQAIDEGVEVVDVKAMIQSAKAVEDLSDFNSLDKDILHVVYMCEWGGVPEVGSVDYQYEYLDFITEFYDYNVDPANAYSQFPSDASYWQYNYMMLVQNMNAYPRLRKLFEQYKSGVITNQNLSDWDYDSKADYLCWGVYEFSWWREYITDYVFYGVHEASTNDNLIPLFF